MKNNHIQKTIDDDLYEIIELNESEPIVFKQTRKKQQELYNTLDGQNNKRIMLVIPNSDKYSHGRFN